MLTMSRCRFIETPATMSAIVQDALSRQVENAGTIQRQDPELLVLKNEIPMDQLENFAIVRHPLSWLPAFFDAQRRTGWRAARQNQDLLICSHIEEFEPWVRAIIERIHGFQSQMFRRWFGRNLDQTTAAPFEFLTLSVPLIVKSFGEDFDKNGLECDIGQSWSGYRSTEHFWKHNWCKGELSWTDRGLVREVVAAEAPIVARFYPEMDFVATCPKG